MDLSIITYLFLGIAPSLVWLFYYLSKDLHPEPKRMIVKIFLWGAFMTIPVYFLQTGLTVLLDILSKNLGTPHLDCLSLSASLCPTPYIGYIQQLAWPELNFLTLCIILAYYFLVIGFSEEFFKYLVIKIKVINSPHLDEPLDVMLYMVVAALGFAAVENILYILATMGSQTFEMTLLIELVRSIGAVFLHTLCAAVIGYFLAISFCNAKWKFLTVSTGIILAVVLHGLFDFFIITLPKPFNYYSALFIIILLAVLTYVGFEKLKKMKGVCKIK